MKLIYFVITMLPKNFPELSLMYKTLRKRIQDLEKEQRITLNENQKNQIQIKIKTYQKEIENIKSHFPDAFFEKEL